MNLQKITTPTGSLVPLMKETEEFWSDYDIRFVYASTALPGSVKGPHLHMKRECRLVVVRGRVDVVTKKEGEYETTTLDWETPSFLQIPAGTPFRIANNGEEEAVILNFANHVWREDDQDSYPVEDWDYEIR